MKSFDDLKKYAISDILSASGKDKITRVAENHINNLIEVSLIKGAQSRQSEVDELKNNSQQPSGHVIRMDAYKSGAQSRQAEIDQAYADIEAFAMEVKKEKSLKSQYFNERCELQKRIDDALKLLCEFNCPQEYGVDDIWTAIDILKG